MSEPIKYDKLADMFLKKYKDYVLSRLKKPPQSRDIQHFQQIVNSNSVARDIVNNSQRLCHIYDNSEWQSKVFDTLDLDIIYYNVDKMPQTHEDEYSDNLVKELLRYFKRDFFTWCNQPKCTQCSEDSHQEMIGMDQPNNEERQFQCGNVELYKCRQCKMVTRFPRYNDPTKLLETKTGRCGEWCNLFMLILKSFGLEARYVINFEDHVWNEYYSPYLKRWVHIDSCEQSFDEPHIYSVNWNKKMSYCIAYGKYDVVDVSKKYILQNELPRDKIDDKELNFVCQILTKQLREGLNDRELYKIFTMDEQDYLNSRTEDKKEEDHITNENKGRQSGSKEWTTSRGENGSK